MTQPSRAHHSPMALAQVPGRVIRLAARWSNGGVTFGPMEAWLVIRSIKAISSISNWRGLDLGFKDNKKWCLSSKKMEVCIIRIP